VQIQICGEPVKAHALLSKLIRHSVFLSEFAQILHLLLSTKNKLLTTKSFKEVVRSSHQISVDNLYKIKLYFEKARNIKFFGAPEQPKMN
jgi:hypothetical protein